MVRPSCGVSDTIVGITSPLHAQRVPFGIVLSLDPALCQSVIRDTVEIMIGTAPAGARAVDRATKAYVVARTLLAKVNGAEVSLEGATALYRQLFSMSTESGDDFHVIGHVIRDEVLRLGRRV